MFSLQLSVLFRQLFPWSFSLSISYRQWPYPTDLKIREVQYGR